MSPGSTAIRYGAAASTLRDMTKMADNGLPSDMFVLEDLHDMRLGGRSCPRYGCAFESLQRETLCTVLTAFDARGHVIQVKMSFDDPRGIADGDEILSTFTFY